MLAGKIAQAASSDEFNFSWLDPDKKVYVLQNRRYLKSEHFLVSAMLGTGFSNAYRTVYSVDPRAAYYFTEDWGVEGFYTAFSNSANSTYEALAKSAPTALPFVREVKSQYGLLAHWSPWYAKINVFNSILYFDWYFTGGYGHMKSQLNTQTVAGAPPINVSDSRSAFFAGTGHQFHLSEHFIFRLDFTGAFYSAPVYGTSGENRWYSDYRFALGMGLRL